MCYQREKQIDRKKDRQDDIKIEGYRDIKIVCVMTYERGRKDSQKDSKIERRQCVLVMRQRKETMSERQTYSHRDRKI